MSMSGTGRTELLALVESAPSHSSVTIRKWIDGRRIAKRIERSRCDTAVQYAGPENWVNIYSSSAG